MSDLKKRMKNIDLGIKKKNKDAIFVGTQGILAGEQGHTLAQWMADKFNHNFDSFDKAIDSLYNLKHVGGASYHHLLDGQHTIWGAFNAIQDTKIDDSWAEELMQATEHLIRDTTSVSGINPFFSFTPEQFDSLGSIVSSIGISKEYLADALTINGPELLGGSIALISSIIMGKKANPERLSYLSGGCLISSLTSANPMLLPIAVSGMTYAIYKNDNKKQIILQLSKGSLVSGSALFVSSLVGGSTWLSCVAGFMAVVAVSKGIEKAEKALKNSMKLIEPARNISKMAIAQLS